MIFNGDNASTQHLVSYPVHHAHSKLIDIRYHNIREVNIYVADILAKNQSKTKHLKFVEMLGLS